MTSILIGVPCLDTIKIQTAHMIALLAKHSFVDKIVFMQNCLVHISRIKIAEMAKDFSHLFFIDSDMCFNPRVLERLLFQDKDIIGGLYYRRSLPRKSVVGVYIDGKPSESIDIPKETFRCYATGTGCMLIKSSVFDRIEKPWFFYQSDPEMGEDIWFCRQAEKVGIEVWCDPTVEVGHIGEYIY